MQNFELNFMQSKMIFTQGDFMVEIYLLEQFVALAKYETLAAAAENLHLSQSALSRSMQKLEEIFGVKLFVRKKNRIALNDTGKFAAEYAEKILLENENLVEDVRDFDRKNRTISIGSCAPIPMNKLIWLLTEIFPSVAISSEMNSDEYLLRGLKKDLFQLIILHEKPIDEDLFIKNFGSEKLYLVLPPNHKFADKKGIFLEELNGEKILLYSKIGFWYELCKKKAPSAKFLMQTERETFTEIANSMAFPSFTTDIFLRNGIVQKNCVYKPILDSEANATYYCTCKKNKQEFFRKLFEKIGDLKFFREIKLQKFLYKSL